MIRFLGRLTRATLGIGVFLMALAAIAYWYVSRGPIDVGVLKPRLQAAISRAVPGLAVDFGALSAERDSVRGIVVVQAQNVTLSHDVLAAPVRVQNMTIVLPQRALIGDNPVPRAIIISGVRADLHWTPGQLKSWFAGDDDGTPPRLPWLDGLDKISVRDVEIALRETTGALPVKKNRDVLTVTSLTAERGLLFSKNDIRIDLAASLVERQGLARLGVTAKGKAVPKGQWEADVEVTANAPQRYVRAFYPGTGLPATLPRLAASSTITATEIVRGKTTVRLSPGSFVWSPLYPKAVPVQASSFVFVWNDVSPRVDVRKAKIRLAGVDVAVSGTVQTDAVEKSKLSGTVKKLPVEKLVALWPVLKSDGGRSWIAANVTGGVVRDGIFSLSPAIRKGGEPKIIFDFRFDDLVAHYRRPMPALLGADGTGKLTNTGVELTVTRGFINNVTVPQARIVIASFADTVQTADVDLSLSGNLPDLLAILDSEPLGFISRYGVVPSQISGAVSGNVKLKIPLLNSVTMDDVTLSAVAQTRNARVPDVYAGKPLEGADLAFVVTRENLVARGIGFLNSNPLSLVWSEDFTGTVVNPTQYDIVTRTSASALAGLGIDLQTVLLGDFPATLQLAGRGSTISAAKFSADLFNAQLTAEPFGIVKPVGVAARATGSFAQAGKFVVFDDIRIASVPVNAALTAKVPVDSGSSEVAIKNFSYGGTKLQGTIVLGDARPMQVMLTGGDIDLRPELTRWRNSQTAAPTSKAKTFLVASSLSAPGAAPFMTQLTGKVDKVVLLNGIALNTVVLDAKLLDDVLTSASIKAVMGEKAATNITMVTKAASRTVQLRTDDGGLLAQALDIYRNGRGGKLVIDADISGKDKTLAITGMATMTNFRIINAPALAKTLTIASLAGLSDTLAGRGIEFKTVEAPFTLKRGVIDVRKASAIGPGLGITMGGQVSRATGQTNMRGTIVPSYGLNAAIGKIPLVGNIIVGGKNQGLIGFNYRITGTTANPKIDVTKSSGLAPGFLRQLFKGKAAVLDPALEAAGEGGSQ